MSHKPTHKRYLPFRNLRLPVQPGAPLVVRIVLGEGGIVSPIIPESALILSGAPLRVGVVVGAGGAITPASSPIVEGEGLTVRLVLGQGGVVTEGLSAELALSSFSYVQDPIPASAETPATITFTATMEPGANDVAKVRFQIGAQYVDAFWTHGRGAGDAVAAWPQLFTEATPTGGSYPLTVSAVLASGEVRHLSDEEIAVV